MAYKHEVTIKFAIYSNTQNPQFKTRDLFTAIEDKIKLIQPNCLMGNLSGTVDTDLKEI